MVRLKHWFAWAGAVSGLMLAVPAGAGDAPLPPEQIQVLRASTSAYKDYMLNCAGCHRYDGEGVGRSAVPSFRDSIGLFTRSQAGREYMIRVPGSAQSLLGNAELAAVLNWMVAMYSPDQLTVDFKPFTANEVGASRPYRFDNVVIARRQISESLGRQGLHLSPYLYGSN